MTRTEVENLVACWQERLRLGHWSIRVNWVAPVEKGFDAEIKISEDYEQASVRIQQVSDPASDPPTKPYTEWTEREANETIVHELLHIFEKQTRRPVESFIPDDPTQAQDLLWAWYMHGAENWVDRLAVAIVDLVMEPAA